HGTLPYDRARRLVGTQTLETALPDQPVTGPAAKRDLRHQHRLDEMSVPHDVARNAVDRRRLAFMLPELLRKVAEPRHGVAGADAAGVAQLALLAHAEEERRERPAGLGRGPPADDDELLLQAALGLEPASGAAGVVAVVGALGNDAFELEVAGVLEHLRALAVQVIGAEQRALLRHAGEQRLEHFLALAQPLAAQILAVEMKQVEQVVAEPAAALRQRVLQRAEI